MADTQVVEDIQLPDFLETATDIDDIHGRMLEELPEDIDKTEGGFVWDFTRPTAVIAAEIIQYFLPETLKTMFPQWSFGKYLDYIGEIVQVYRKPASKASTVMTIAGDPGTIIPAGTTFDTESINNTPSIEYATVSRADIPNSGKVDVVVEAVAAGSNGNVNAEKIVIMSSPLRGVNDYINKKAATGGSDEEDDDTFRNRILETMKTRNQSYVGNENDFRRWALEVPGIGDAIVVPTWDGPETVKVVCIDTNGQPASNTLTKAVYDHIMRPDDEYERLAPPNVILTVSVPEPVDIAYKITGLSLDTGYTIEGIKGAFGRALDKYYAEVPTEGKIKIISVSAELENIDGVDDFESITMNGKLANITIGIDQYPRTASIDIGGTS